MTPSNYYNNQNERNSMSSEVFTQGESALPPFSEYFNPNEYECERVPDSNDQSPMGKSQSQLSDYNLKLSNKGGNTKDIISKKKYGSYSISDMDLQMNQIW